MENNWQLVYSTNKAFEAEMVRGLLESEGLEPIVLNKQDSSYMFGEIEVYVHPDQKEQAINIIKSSKNE